MALRIAPAVLLLFSAALAAPYSFPAVPAKPAPEFLPPTVGILLRFDRPPGTLFLKALRRELEYIFQPAGLDLRWEVLDGTTVSGSYNRVVLVEMHGHCNPSGVRELHHAPQPNVPLGWTIVNDGEVISRVAVDCDAIGGLASEMRGRFTNSLMVERIFLRVLGRVVGHEMLHALLATPDHHNSPYTRAHLRAADVLAVPRLSSDEVSRLREALYHSPKISVAQAPAQ